MGRSSLGARKSTSIRFPDALHARLREAADERDLPINYLVVAAVRDFLDRLLPVDDILLTRPPGNYPEDPR